MAARLKKKLTKGRLRTALGPWPRSLILRRPRSIASPLSLSRRERERGEAIDLGRLRIRLMAARLKKNKPRVD